MTDRDSTQTASVQNTSTLVAPGPDKGVTTPSSGALTTDAAKDGEILPPRKSLKSYILPALLLAGIGFGATKGYEWFVEGRFIVATDDAYVKADMSIIAAKVSGYLASVPAVENAFVHAGDLLASIDPVDYELAVKAAKDKIATQDATIERITRQAEAQSAMIAQAKAQLAAAQGQLEAAKSDSVQAELEYQRSEKLVQSSFGTAQRAEQALASRNRASAMVVSSAATGQASQSAIDAAQASLAVYNAQKTEASRVRNELETALQKTQSDLAFTQIHAPFDGVVGNRAAQPGQFVQPGTRLLALVPLGSIYVEANFKETQLGRLKPGQKVSVRVDALAGQTIEGIVDSIAPASGSQYSLLPPENATGNFTKIVQRVPVRIKVPLDIAQSGVLRPGLSVVADVNTRDDSKAPPSLMGAMGLTRE